MTDPGGSCLFSPILGTCGPTYSTAGLVEQGQWWRGYTSTGDFHSSGKILNCHLGILLNADSDSSGLVWGLEPAFLTSSQVRLRAQPTLEQEDCRAMILKHGPVSESPGHFNNTDARSHSQGF